MVETLNLLLETQKAPIQVLEDFPSRVVVLIFKDSVVVEASLVATLRVMQQEAPGLFSDFEVYVAPDRAEAARIGYHKI